MKNDFSTRRSPDAAVVNGGAASVATVARKGRSATGPTIPWQPRPAGSQEIVWRHMGNPIISRNFAPGVQGIYNSAVAHFGDGFVGVFRVEKRDRFPHLHVGWSDNALDWHIEPDAIAFLSGGPQSAAADYAYDPRVCNIEGTYYITWCGGHNGPTISVAATEDFRNFERLENAFLPFNRNGV